MIAKTNIPNINFDQIPQIPLAQAELEVPTNRHSPRRTELLDNAPYITEPTVELPIPVLSEVNELPVQVMAPETIGSRIKNRFTKARDAIKNVFQKESNPAEKVRTRKRTLAGIAGSMAVGLVMAGSIPSAPVAPAAEKATTTTTTIVAENIQFPTFSHDVAKQSGDAVQHYANVYQVIVEHPEESKRLFDWIIATDAENLGIDSQS